VARNKVPGSGTGFVPREMLMPLASVKSCTLLDPVPVRSTAKSACPNGSEVAKSEEYVPASSMGKANESGKIPTAKLSVRFKVKCSE
jgi:hypothetical protein